jgi:hypothetical protein
MKGNANEDGVGILLVIAILVTIIAIVAIVFAVLAATQAHKAAADVPVAAGTCTCKDTKDLENRQKVVNAAIAEYQNGIADVTAHDAEVGKPTMFNEGTWDEEQANVLIAIKAVLPTGAHTGHGDTTTDCGTVVNADTPCLQGSIQTHENVHRATCQRVIRQLSDAGKGDRFQNFKESMTMVDVWKDEIAGYNAETEYITRNLATAKSDTSCRWECDVDHKSYDSHEECERSCRPKLGSNIRLGFRCSQV